MAGETSKTNKIRPAIFFEKYCQGSILDIGGGISSVTPGAEVFDLEHGDAQKILEYLEPESFDCVYSSHCVEHMLDARAAIEQWWALTSPGGHMIIVVPDEDLYEQGVWPSMFNSDHKYTFAISKEKSWSPASINIDQMLSSLDRAKIISIELQDDGYDYNLNKKVISPFKHSLWNYKKDKGVKRMFKHLLFLLLYYPVYVYSNSAKGRIIDQTTGEALAQIQVVVKKMI